MHINSGKVKGIKNAFVEKRNADEEGDLQNDEQIKANPV